MNCQYIKLGMEVVISKRLRGKYSSETQGWSDNMNKYIGTTQKICWVSDNGKSIKFEDLQFYWDCRDVYPLQSFTEDISMNEKKEIFDINELGL